MFQYGYKVAPLGGKLIAPRGREAANNTTSLEFIESPREGARIDGGDGALEISEPLRSSREITEDKRGPFLANDSHGAGDTAGAGFKRGRFGHKLYFV